MVQKATKSQYSFRLTDHLMYYRVTHFAAFSLGKLLKKRNLFRLSFFYNWFRNPVFGKTPWTGNSPTQCFSNIGQKVQIPRKIILAFRGIRTHDPSTQAAKGRFRSVAVNHVLASRSQQERISVKHE
jgi:hypothetical protein